MTEKPSANKQLSPEQVAAFQRLRRLQEHSRSNIPAMLAHRSVSTFSLQREPVPPEASGEVQVVVYPQDPFIGEPEVRRMSTQDIRPGLINSRVQVEDSAGDAAQPDEDGNYMYEPGTIEFDQVNSFYYTTFTLRRYERYARRAIPWSFPSPRITLDPHVGSEANAFYNEQDRLLGFHTFKTKGEALSTAQSADIVSHEAAHAVLDGLRDAHNESFGLGPTAFHESFGDMTAVLVALHDDSLIKRALEWTGGDLRLGNFVAQIAEHLTASLRYNIEHVSSHSNYLRNALNDLHEVPFNNLPYLPDDPQTQLGRESHNYSRLFTGAFYDILTGIYDTLKGESAPYIAVHQARDVLGYLLTGAVELGPVGEFDFGDMARSFLSADAVLYDGRHRESLTQVFDNRGILPRSGADAHLAEQATLPDIRLPESINSALAAALFLEEECLPALALPSNLDLIPMGTHRNGAGHAYLSYFFSQRIILEGERYQQFDGAGIDVFGGLTLMFDATGRLRSVCFRPVSAEDVRQIEIMVADLINRGLIADSLPVTGDLTAPQPQALHLPGFPGKLRRDEARLVKFPALFDAVPEPPDDLGDYLQAWMEKEQ